MSERLTDKLVKSLEPPETGNIITYDDEIKGFGVRITATGARAFILNYRTSGRERRMTIGAYPDWSVAAAREEAKILKRLVDRGEDPMGERHAERAAPDMQDLADRYMEEHLPKKRPSSQRNDRHMLNALILPPLRRLKVADVAYADIDALHRALKKTPYRANRVVALLSKMFNLAIRWEMRSDNPAKGIERFPEPKRERYLSGEERVRLLNAMSEHSAQSTINHQTVQAFRLAMLTGARIGEVLGAAWDQLDLAKAVWTKPSAITKQKTTHRVVLNAPTVALLTELQNTSKSPYLFPSPTGAGPQTDYKKAWAKIRDTADLPGLRVHDLRHNFASEGASAGLSLPMIGALLGHTNPATTARYAHLMDDPLREATERIGSRLSDHSATKTSRVSPAPKPSNRNLP